MKSKSRLILVLFFLAGAFVVYHFFGQNWAILGASKTFYSDFGKTLNNANIESIVNTNLREKKGHFAVVVEELESTSAAKLTSGEPGLTPEEVLPLRKYVLNEKELFPSASLYKLVLITAVLKEVEVGRLKLEDIIPGSKSDLTEKMGGLDFGYEDMPENFEFSVDEALTRVGRISDNFAAIMLTNRLAQLPKKDSEDGLLIQMSKEIGMNNTDFMADPIVTTAFDIGTFFKALYNGQIVSKEVSQQIINYLSLSQINDRIPALLPDDVKVVHKTGELPMLRHDAGLVYLNGDKRDYLIVLLSKDLQYEDDGVETLANISGDVYNYFSGLAGN